MSNYISKAVIDGTEAYFKDTEARDAIASAKSDISDINAYILKSTANSDITTQLQSAINNKKHVMLIGGPYTISKRITIPYGSTLDGGGTTLNCTSGMTDWAFVIGATGDVWKNPKEKTGISHLNVQCNRHCSGLDIAQAGALLDGVLVQDVKSDGTGFAIFPGNIEAKSSDVNIINCGVYNNLDVEYTCTYGLDVWAYDNTINNFKTIGTVNGVRVRKYGGGTYLFECHPLACDSSLSVWPGSKGFWLENDAILVNCYNDNFNYGIYTDGQWVRGINFFSNYYETNRTAQRYVYYGTTAELHLQLLNIMSVPQAITIGNAVNLDITKQTSCFYTVESDPSNRGLITNDMGYDIYAHGGQNYIVPDNQTTGLGPLFAVPSPGVYKVAYAPISIMCGQFAILDMLVKQTADGSTVLDWGRLVKNSSEISGTITIKMTKHDRSDGLTWFSIDATTGTSYIGGYNVISKSGILYLPTYIKTSDFGSAVATTSHTYTA